MNVQDLPLPLRLRNSLLNANIKTDADILAFMVGEGGADAPPSATTTAGVSELRTIPGIGPTGMRQLKEWAASVSAAPKATSPVAVAPKPAVEVDKTSRWNTNALATAALDSRIAAGRATIVQAGGSVEVSTSKDALSLTLERELLARLDALIGVVGSLPHAKEFGIVVDRKIVARMALIRGLDALERAHQGKNGAEKPEKAAKSADPEPDDAIPVVDPDADVYSTPEGWTKVGPNDKIPVPEAVLHDYYSQNGWFRYWGMVDGTPIYFYWCPEKRLQDLDPFPGADKSGRRVAVQTTPWGPGHVVPVKWANS